MTQWTSTASPHRYAYLPSRPPPAPKVTTSWRELGNIVVAASVLTFDIAYIAYQSFSLGIGGWWGAALFGVAAALTGFVFHELAHKVAAQRRGYWAEFRMSLWGLSFSVITTIVIGFLFAAPGATMVSGMSDREAWGRTSLAGPALNLAEGGVFTAIGLGLIAVPAASAYAPFLILLGFFNGWFATFNLIPIGPLDGHRVLAWDRGVWAGAFVVSAALAIFTFLVFYGFLVL
ncbi:MAG: site-2 protease family protein [Thermoplasmata archaeon]